MKSNFQTPYMLVFLLVFAFTIYGISEVAKSGGPCNGGLAFIFLMPVLLICSALQIISVYRLAKNQKKELGLSILLSSTSLAIWTFSIYMTSGENDQKSVLYLGGFEIQNILTILMAIKQNADNKQKDIGT